VIYKSCHSKSGVCQIDSEFGFIGKVFVFGKINKVLDSLDK